MSLFKRRLTESSECSSHEGRRREAAWARVPGATGYDSETQPEPSSTIIKVALSAKKHLHCGTVVMWLLSHDLTLLWYGFRTEMDGWMDGWWSRLWLLCWGARMPGGQTPPQQSTSRFSNTQSCQSASARTGRRTSDWQEPPSHPPLHAGARRL